jgi:hypothetical protein
VLLPQNALARSQVDKQSPAPWLRLQPQSRHQSLFLVSTLGSSIEHTLICACTVANNFWGKDDAGVGPMLERVHNAKVTSDELKSFYAGTKAPKTHSSGHG